LPVPPLPAMAIRKLTGCLLDSRETIHNYIGRASKRNRRDGSRENLPSTGKQPSGTATAA
jgi:hypothetical protein